MEHLVEQKLLGAVRAWIEKHQVRCGESIYQVDSVQEGLYDLATECCEIVGYYKDPE